MAEIVTRKVRLGLSACLMGCPVRYNGKAFEVRGVMGRERQDFVFTPVCPECMAGFGVPRPPIHLTGTGHEVLDGQSRVVDQKGRDVTARLVDGAEACREALERADVDAVVLKESSPSCGLFRTRVGRGRHEQPYGPGVFGAMLHRSPYTFVVPDTALDSPLMWWDVRRRMHAFVWLKGRPIERVRDLYDSWHVVKSVLQETDRRFADAMGAKVGSLREHAEPAALEALRAEMLCALRTPSTKPRIRQAMWKTYRQLTRRGKLDGVDLDDLDVRSPEVQRNTTAIAEALVKMERISFENDLLFATTPVLVREPRRVRARDEAFPKG